VRFQKTLRGNKPEAFYLGNPEENHLIQIIKKTCAVPMAVAPGYYPNSMTIAID
jgi:hypothetical protein